MMETKLGQIMEAILLMRVLFLSVDLIMFVRVMAGSLQWTKIASHLSLQNYDSVKTMQDLSKKNIYGLIQKFSLLIIAHQSLKDIAAVFWIVAA